MLALETARRSDEEYLDAFNGLDDEDETSAIGQRIERALKDRVRASLGLPPRPTRETVTPADHARSKGFEPSYDLPILGQNAEQNAAHLDDRIQTLLFPDQMERKLSGIRDGARTYLSEIGVNTLYAVFGCLEWYESDASDRRFFAPLLLHPLEIERSLVRRAYRYTICSTGEETETNLTLRERLARDFHLALPELDEQDTPDSYFSKVEETIADMKRWRVRRFVTVGLFSFGRIAMYHDLDPKRWPKDKALHLKPLLVELLGGSEGDSVFSDEYDLDDPKIAAEVPLLITDADSSQFAAILEVMRGRNLAIKGPPGTGKSQTITNLIAAALVRGLKVLFVSEKMAALEVVKKRLDEAGLGEFCLELHSTKARKKDLLESLQRRLDVRPLPEPDALALHVRQYEDLRRQLTAYAELINQPYGQSHRTLQELFWAGTRARARARELDIPTSLDGITIDGPADLSIVDIEERRRSLIRLEEHAASLTGGVPERHPWSGVCRADLSPFDYELLIGAFKDWHESLVAVAKECARSKDFGLPAPRSGGEVALLVKALSLLPEDPDPINF